MGWLLALPAVTGCAASPADEAPGAAGEDVDDVDDVGGKVDGPTVQPVHAVASYRPTREGFVTTGPLSGVSGGLVDTGHVVVAIRRLTLDGQDVAVMVDAHDLSVIVARSTDVIDHTRSASDAELAGTRYLRALASHANHAFAALDPTALDASHRQARFALTVDMCQSSRPWERTFFEGLVDLGHAIGTPLPVGIAMTGRWANAHPAELARLVAWNNDGSLRITWIDHSYNHQLKDAQGHYTFLTDPTIDLTKEVTRLEVLLLAQGQRISPFFRFPGLVHNAARLAEINQLSLFALDSDAWLAKGEPVDDGSVVLVHGNGNEHVGIQMWRDDLSAWRARLLAGTAEIAPVGGIVAASP